VEIEEENKSNEKDFKGEEKEEEEEECELQGRCTFILVY
jgi:hypothetical protein